MENKLRVVIMGQDCENFIDMALESVKDADSIIYCDGGSKPQFWRYFDEKIFELGIKDKVEKIHNAYDQNIKEMNGRQRNFYLTYLQNSYPDDWCLAIDADEVVADLSKVKKFIQIAPSTTYFVHMRHFQQDLGHEDATKDNHYVANRLFKVSEADKYPEVEHSVLIPKPITEKQKEFIGWSDTPTQSHTGYIGLVGREEQALVGSTACTTIWHLAYIPNLWDIKKRYECHKAKSEMHTPEFLKSWYRSHLFGSYPKRPIAAIDVPGVILRKFDIHPDEFYFQTHKELEVKHFIMAKQWLQYTNSKSVLDLGCGLGMFGIAFEVAGVEKYQGMELSQWAVDNTKYPMLKIKQGDITEQQEFKDFDLVLANDVLEHLNYKDLDKTLELLKGYGDKLLVSVPLLGDPNLDADPTHIIKEDGKWWMNKFKEAGWIQEATPEWFMFKEQIFIFNRGTNE